MNREHKHTSRSDDEGHASESDAHTHTESTHHKLKVKRSSNYLCIESEILFSYFTLLFVGITWQSFGIHEIGSIQSDHFDLFFQFIFASCRERVNSSIGQKLIEDICFGIKIYLGILRK